MGCEAGGGRELGDKSLKKLSLTILFTSMTEAVGCPPHTQGDPGYPPLKTGGGYCSPGGAMLLAGNGGRRGPWWWPAAPRLDRGRQGRGGEGRGGDGRRRGRRGPSVELENVLLRGGPGEPRDRPQEVRTPRGGFRDPEVPRGSARRV